MIRKIFITGLILSLCSIHTGNSKNYANYYDLQLNVIKKADALQEFFAKIDRVLYAKSGKINIVHIGDSHIQADYFSGQLRRKLQASFGNGGRGFVFPYQIAKSNGPVDIKVSHKGDWWSYSIMKDYEGMPIGASGYLVEASDSAEILIKLSPLREATTSFKKFTVFQSGGRFVPEQDNFHPLVSALGGSEQMPYSTYLLSDYQDSIHLRAQVADSQRLKLHGFSFENTNAGIVYHAMGTNGSSTLHYLRSTKFENQIAALDADLIIVSFGTNDSYLPYSRFCSSCATDRFRTLINRIRKQSPEAAILLTTPADHFYRRRYDNRNLWYLRKSMLRLAEQENVAVWDLYELMGGQRSILDWQKGGLARKDLIHFSKEGYTLQGDLLYQAIMDAYESRFN